jgi:hypothetical protein
MTSLVYVLYVVVAAAVVIFLTGTFLEHDRPQGPRLRLACSDFAAFVKSLWLLGVWYRGRRAYWRFCVTTLLRWPRQFHQAMELAIIGHHFRRTARLL